MSEYLTWFTVCDYNTLEHFGAPFVCFHCSICLAGFPDKRLFFDGDNNIAMLLSKNTNTNHHFEIDITIGMFSAVNKSWLSCSQGDLLFTVGWHKDIAKIANQSLGVSNYTLISE